MNKYIALSALSFALAFSSAPATFAGAAQQSAAVAACNAIPANLADCAVALRLLSQAEFDLISGQLTLSAADLGNVLQSVTFSTAALPNPIAAPTETPAASGGGDSVPAPAPTDASAT